MKFTARELSVMGKLAAKFLKNPDKPIEIENIENVVPQIRGNKRRNKKTLRNATAHFMRTLCLKMAASGIGFERTTLVGRGNNAEYRFTNVTEAKRALKASEAGPVKTVKPPKEAKSVKPKAPRKVKPKSEATAAKKEVSRGSVIKRVRKPKAEPITNVVDELAAL